MKKVCILLICFFWFACCIGQTCKSLDSVRITIVYIDSVGNYYAIYGIDSVNNEKYKIISVKVYIDSIGNYYTFEGIDSVKIISMKDTNYEDTIVIGSTYFFHLTIHEVDPHSPYGGFITGEAFLAHKWGWNLYYANELAGLHYKACGYDWNPEVVHPQNKREIRKCIKRQIKAKMQAQYESAPLME